MYLAVTRMIRESYFRRLRSFVVVCVWRFSSTNYLPCVLTRNQCSAGQLAWSGIRNQCSAGQQAWSGIRNQYSTGQQAWSGTENQCSSGQQTWAGTRNQYTFLTLFFASAPCLSSSLLPSSFIIFYLLTPFEDSLSKALLFFLCQKHLCLIFLVCHRIGEYISLELLAWYNRTGWLGVKHQLTSLELLDKTCSKQASSLEPV